MILGILALSIAVVTYVLRVRLKSKEKADTARLNETISAPERDQLLKHLAAYKKSDFKAIVLIIAMTLIGIAFTVLHILNPPQAATF